jgi:osmotically-inducible protein OsmY
MNTNSRFQHDVLTEPGFERDAGQRPDCQQTDSQLAYAALEALRRDEEVPPYRFSVKVDDGVVTLQGTADWFYQRAAAARAVRFLTGVAGVRNEIAVVHPVVIRDLKKRINDALHRAVAIDAKRIRLEVADGAVTLKGTLRSSLEREEALRAARSAPGVRKVNDLMQVSTEPEAVSARS